MKAQKGEGILLTSHSPSEQSWVVSLCLVGSLLRRLTYPSPPSPERQITGWSCVSRRGWEGLPSLVGMSGETWGRVGQQTVTLPGEVWHPVLERQDVCNFRTEQHADRVIKPGVVPDDMVL